MAKKARKVRKYTSPHIPSKEKREAELLSGSRFLTEEEKDEIEADMETGESKARKVAEKKKK